MSQHLTDSLKPEATLHRTVSVPGWQVVPGIGVCNITVKLDLSLIITPLYTARVCALYSVTVIFGVLEIDPWRVGVVTRLWSSSWSVVVVVARKEPARLGSGLVFQSIVILDMKERLI